MVSKWLGGCQVSKQKKKKTLVAPKWFRNDLVATRFPSETKIVLRKKKQKT
jgi:hypothetical protein